MISDLYGRQARLAEVGERGQARICQARFEVARHPGAQIEREYLRRAGANAELSDAPPANAFAHEMAFRFDVSRDLAEGAWRALDKLRALLLPPGSPQ